jgi:hypothetical protein
MPVTRSTTYAERRTRSNHAKADTTETKCTDAKYSKPKTTKSKITKAKAAQPSTLSTTVGAGQSGTSLKHASRRVKLLEWLSLKDKADGVVPGSDKLFSLLRELGQQKGCKVVARGRPRELSDIEWLIIGKFRTLYATNMLGSIYLTKS